MLKKIKANIKLLRIKHYVKNFLVVLPMFFAGQIFNINLYSNAFYGFLSFCLLSSIIYIINDLHDIEDDKKHPIKCKRPLASGDVSKSNACILMLLFGIVIVIINLIVFKNSFSWLYLLVYLILNVSYTYKLKNKPIIDVVILSFGFLIRVLYGGSILNVNVSNWLFLTILSGALFLSMGKRRNELMKNGSSSRKVLEFYSVDFLTKNMYMFLGMTLVFFSLWVLEQNVNYIVWLIPIVFVIFLKYSYNLENNSSYGDPVDVIFSDKLLIILCIFFVIIMSCMLYVPLFIAN